MAETKSSSEILSVLLEKAAEIGLSEGDYLRTANSLKQVFAQMEKPAPPPEPVVNYKTHTFPLDCKGKIKFVGLYTYILRIRKITWETTWFDRHNVSTNSHTYGSRAPVIKMDWKLTCINSNKTESLIHNWNESSIYNVYSVAKSLDLIREIITIFSGVDGMKSTYPDWKAATRQEHIDNDMWDEDEADEVLDKSNWLSDAVCDVMRHYRARHSFVIEFNPFLPRDETDE